MFSRILLSTVLALGTINISQCETEDLDGDGSPANEDCDDWDLRVYPGALEICDTVDNDCDLTIDEGFVDSDGDGAADCTTRDQDGDGFTPVQGDCDDLNPAVHPGAAEVADDEFDSDCGGFDGPQPHVGLSVGSLPTIQEAIDSATTGETLWVGPGTYAESGLRLHGIDLRLRSTHGYEETIIDAQEKRNVMSIAQGESPSTLIQGFTLTHGRDCNGGLVISYASPTIDQLYLTENYAEGYMCEGGGMDITGSASTISNTIFARNQGMYGGAGVYSSDSSERYENCTFVENAMDGEGEAFDGWNFQGSFTDSVFEHNFDDAIKVSSSDFTMTRVKFLYNEGTFGPAIETNDSNIEIRESTFIGNASTQSKGGAIYMSGGGGIIRNTLFLGNQSKYYGGAIYLVDATPEISNCLFSGNSAPQGGGIYLDESGAQPTIRNSIFYNNAGHNLYRAWGAGDPDIEYSVIFNTYGPNHNMSSVDSSNILEAPEFIYWLNRGDPDLEDYHLPADSPLRNAGDPSLLNPDGSTSDIGLYGGPDGDLSYYLDMDLDGLFDGWESRYGLDPTQNDATEDSDGDGLDNSSELANHCIPLESDTDRDGARDGDEVGSSSDPIDWYSRPGSSEAATAQLPGDFDSIEEAIEQIINEGNIRVSAGSYNEALAIVQRKVKLEAPEGPDETLITGDFLESISLAAAPIMARSAELNLSGFTLTGGSNENGGGISVEYTAATLENLHILENFGRANGGGLYVRNEDEVVTLRNSVISGNRNDAENGGGIYAEGGSLTVQHVLAEDNYSANDGGALYVYGTESQISHARVINNYSILGSPGIFADNVSTLKIDHSLIANNMSNGRSTENYGTGAGGVFLNDGTLEMSHTIVAYNEYNSVRIRNGSATVSYSNLYQADVDEENYYPADLIDGSCTAVEPGLLAYEDSDGTSCAPGATDCLPVNFHLALDSVLVDAGDASSQDADGSPADPGCYGGTDGSSWDLDLDGYWDYFWPGRFADVPAGVDASGYDGDDLDASAQ